MTFTEQSIAIFREAINTYHKTDNVDTPMPTPYAPATIEYHLYRKAWIDTVQWHLEDIIRDPEISPADALVIKRRIDKSNQDRTDLVEMIDSYFWEKYHNVAPKANARLNTETPAWAFDRLSILQLKIYHMEIEAKRQDASAEHKQKCQTKLDTLLQQQEDLTTAIEQLMTALENGEVVMKVYKQMKMYNDPALNPVLYATGK